MNFGTKKIHILLVGGGTGGHFYPLISIGEALRTSSQNIVLYYAGPDVYDADALAAQNIHFVQIPAGKQRRYASLLNFFDIFKTLYGACIAVLKLLSIYPDVIMSKGGYTSVPVILAAKFLRIPIVVHESDSLPGKANKLAARFAETVVVSYPETHELFDNSNVVHLGIPIRSALLAPQSEQPLQAFNIEANHPLILVLGGSQGAERVNELILDSLDELLPSFSIIHQTGKMNFEVCKSSADALILDDTLRSRYHPIAFLEGSELNDAYHLASIIISRAGSNSIFEIALHGKPSILIPIPETISHDQRTNAYTYARSGATTVMEEGSITPSLLRAEIDRIMQNDDIYKEMKDAATAFAKHNAADAIRDILLGIAQKH
jgi:UDP-N-acetylglucosamine--N-acetylmuramyl-(pentapeptide) pyrophosphoryl-undecaprenol N-acetylglucosamine transferase